MSYHKNYRKELMAERMVKDLLKESPQRFGYLIDAILKNKISRSILMERYHSDNMDKIGFLMTSISSGGIVNVGDGEAFIKLPYTTFNISHTFQEIDHWFLIPCPYADCKEKENFYDICPTEPEPSVLKCSKCGRDFVAEFVDGSLTYGEWLRQNGEWYEFYKPSSYLLVSNRMKGVE